MSGRRLYEKYTDALAKTKRQAWRGDHYELTYPPSKPVAWGFLSDAQRDTFNLLARMITPKPRPKVPAS